MPKEHADLPPSSADKWMKCHAWLKLNRGLLPTTSPAGEEGTRAHLAFEAVLKTSEPPPLIDKTMFGHLEACLEWVNDQDGDKYPECVVDYGSQFGFEGLFGTSDCIIDLPSLLTVADLKYGYDAVEVIDDPQLMCYLSGARHKFGRHPLYRIVILQPRAYHPAGPIRDCFVTNKELTMFETEMVKAIKANYSSSGKACVGDHCRHYCKALSTCPAVKEHAMQLFRKNTG